MPGAISASLESVEQGMLSRRHSSWTPGCHEDRVVGCVKHPVRMCPALRSERIALTPADPKANNRTFRRRDMVELLFHKSSSGGAASAALSCLQLPLHEASRRTSSNGALTDIPVNKSSV